MGAYSCSRQRKHKPALSSPPSTALFKEHFSPAQVVYKIQARGSRRPAISPNVTLLSHGDAGRSRSLEGQQQLLCSSTQARFPPPTCSLQNVCKPNMAFIWPTPAPNPIIKPACLNISHWLGPIQLLKAMTMGLLCVWGMLTSAAASKNKAVGKMKSINVSSRSFAWINCLCSAR